MLGKKEAVVTNKPWEEGQLKPKHPIESVEQRGNCNELKPTCDDEGRGAGCVAQKGGTSGG